MHSPKNSCSKAIFSMAIIPVFLQHCPTTDVFPIADTSSVPKFCYQPVYCRLVWYFLVRLRKAKCFMSSNFDVKLCSGMNTPCLHMHSFYVSNMSSGHATRVTLTRVSRTVASVYYMGVVMLLISCLYCSMWLLLACGLNGTPVAFIWKWSDLSEAQF